VLLKHFYQLIWLIKIFSILGLNEINTIDINLLIRLHLKRLFYAQLSRHQIKFAFHLIIFSLLPPLFELPLFFYMSGFQIIRIERFLYFSWLLTVLLQYWLIINHLVLWILGTGFFNWYCLHCIQYLVSFYYNSIFIKYIQYF
jgi:hypothetical protein